MKIDTVAIPETTIEEFADQHDLVMVIHERKLPVGDPSRYYAAFRHAEVKDGCLLRGTYGNGATPEAAIADYAPRISLQKLVIDAYGKDRREIDVPRLKSEVK